jgi:hypothetical protein
MSDPVRLFSFWEHLNAAVKRFRGKIIPAPRSASSFIALHDEIAKL